MNTPPEDRFKVTGLHLVNHVCDLLEKNESYGKTMLNTMYRYMEKRDPCTFCEEFVKATYKFWDEILHENMNYFKSHSDGLFGMFGQSHIDKFKDMIESAKENENDIKLIWKRLHSLVKISINYIHHKRQPELKNGAKSYTVQFMEDVDIETSENKWIERGMSKLKWEIVSVV